MGNHAALATELEGNARYRAAVNAGDHNTLVQLLNASDPTQTTTHAVTRDQALQAIGDGIRTLTGDQLHRLWLLLAGEEVDLATAAIRTELREIFAANQAVLDRLTTVATREARYAEAFGFARVSLADVREAVRRITTSYYSRYLRGEVP